MEMPDTIKHPENFIDSQWSIRCPHCDEIIGFDGVFHWGWTQGCFGETKITPMDFDGVVERHGHYLIFETKDVGKDTPLGQRITLENLTQAKSFCIIKVWGKVKPESFELRFGYHNESTKNEPISGYGEEALVIRVKKWYAWADKN